MTRTLAALAAVLAAGCASSGPHAIAWLPTRPAQPQTPALAAPCRASDLRARLQTGAATGSVLLGVVLRNAGRAPCALVGRPLVRLVGTRGTPWRAVAAPSQPLDPSALAPPRASLRAVAHGAQAWLAVWWSEWCPPGTPPNGATGRPPDAFVVELPHGRGELRLPLHTAPRCDVPGLPSRLAVQPFAPRIREPAESTRLPLSIAIVGVPARESKLRPPRLQAARGGVLRFDIAITNRSRRAFSFRGCPTYLEQLAPSGSPQLYVLNCKQAATLEPGERTVFAMELRVPVHAPRGANGLVWELAPKTYLPPTTNARVLVR